MVLAPRFRASGLWAAQSSVAWNVLPRDSLVDTYVPWQSQDPLGDDVAHDLTCASFDRVGPASKEGLLRRRIPVCDRRPGHRISLVQQRLRTHDIEQRGVDGLVQVGR